MITSLSWVVHENVYFDWVRPEVQVGVSQGSILVLFLFLFMLMTCHPIVTQSLFGSCASMAYLLCVIPVLVATSSCKSAAVVRGSGI